MVQDSQPKSFFGKAIDALTSRDELAALEAAQQQLTQAQAAAAQANQELANLKATSTQAFVLSASQLSASQTALANATKRAQDAEAMVKQLQQRLNDITRARQIEEKSNRMDAEMPASLEAAKPRFIAEHTLTSEETLSHLSLKYYGSATKPYWMVIYEANKGLIGDNPNRVHAGMVIKIPVLPDSLAKK